MKENILGEIETDIPTLHTWLCKVKDCRGIYRHYIYVDSENFSNPEMVGAMVKKRIPKKEYYGYINAYNLIEGKNI